MQSPERPTKDIDPVMLARLVVEAKPLELALAEEELSVNIEMLDPQLEMPARPPNSRFLRIDVSERDHEIDTPTLQQPPARKPRHSSEGGTTIAPPRPWYVRLFRH